ncbi:two-component system repressor protein LuxO [Nitrospirillum amazonense]|uniref:Two-component system repressor protein LuxO n=1 Tax=Nitrospirillum amazonense TaxID=28077 RepID=A0A560EU77_9PROT|nr:sigma-54 dependent transcriptional regulator [Nitrospirillum amazonense]TWB12930.1 two-component system repressor protein LuxO [Nitrospirillum amazonense]
METRPRRVLIVEPTPSLAAAYSQALRKDGHALQVVDTAPAARRALAEAPADVVLLNLQLPGGNGLDLLKELKADAKAPQVVALTAQGSVQMAVDVMRAGAVDVLLLPAGTERLRQAMAAALAERAKVLEAAPPTAPVEDPLGYLGFVGTSPAMRGVYRMIEAAAPSKATVFITGESGTGKEVCAEAIHRRSPRVGRPFIPVNCAAIPKDLMESEIFGHVKGAFTGATTDHAGAALQADGGTLFLDEIGEMDLSLQAKLLRFLQTGMVKKVGSEKAEAVDVRIVCATNRDPFAEVQAGRFREDLFYRLQVISIELPPLRDRGDDILLIAREFLAKYTQEERKSFTGFSDEAEEIMRTYNWPGNVRQLLNVVRNVVVLNDGAVIQPFMLPPPLNKPTMIVPPMLNDPRWAAMAGPMPFPFTPPPAANLAGPASGGTLGGVAPSGFGMPPMAPAAPAPGGVSVGGARIPGVPAGATSWAAPIPLDDAPAATHDSDPNPERRIRPLWMVEEETIEEAIRLCQGNITRAAALLEINPCTIYRRRQKKRATA